MSESRQVSVFDGTSEDMLNKSITLLKDMESLALQRNPHGYAVGYSGGKDSDALIRVFQLAGVKYFIFHNHTTLDAPETVYYVRRKFAEWEAQGIHCMYCMPTTNFWKLCLQHGMLPLRKVRFCCEQLKEHDDGEVLGSVKSFGVRCSESAGRKKNRDSIETHTKSDFSDIQKFHFDNTEDAKMYMYEQGTCKIGSQKTCVNPLAYWSTDYLHDFLESEVKELNPLYKEGFQRIGCIGCPMAHTEAREREFDRYPKYKARYITLAQQIIDNRVQAGKETYGRTGEEYFLAWVGLIPGLKTLERQKDDLFAQIDTLEGGE